MIFIYILLGASLSLNICLIVFMVFFFKKRDFENEVYEKVDEIKKISDPWSDLK
jgi:hypothetical protein